MQLIISSCEDFKLILLRGVNGFNIRKDSNKSLEVS